MKSGKRHTMEGTELPNQKEKKRKRIRPLGEKETYKYLGILEADTIKQRDERVSQEKEKTTGNQTIQQEPYKRDKYQGCCLCKRLGTILEVDQRT